MIYTLTLNPSIDQHITVRKLVANDKITPEHIYLEPGGKGFNVSRVIQELGAKTKAFGFSGGQSGAMLQGMLSKEKISMCFCPIDQEVRTNLVINDRSKNAHIRINPLGPRLDVEDVNRLFTLIEKISLRPDFWVLCGSVPPGIGEDIYQRLIKIFQGRGERCVLDTDGAPFKSGLKARPFMIKPNAFELKRLMGRSSTTRSEVLSAGRKLAQSADIVAITMAQKGAYFFAQKEAWHCCAPVVNVKSDVGAGDAFLGGFLKALDGGEDLMSASRWAVAAATSSVTNNGTARCQRRDVERIVGRVVVTKC